MAFYKLIDDVLHCGPNYVYAPEYTLIADNYQEYTYPVDGWYWFDSATEAQKVLCPTVSGLPATAITKLAFRNRFTAAEKVAIEIAQLDDPAADMAVRAQAAALRSSQADVMAATFVNLARADTRAGVQTLEAVGLLAAGRAAVILDSPIQPEERPT